MAMGESLLVDGITVPLCDFQEVSLNGRAMPLTLPPSCWLVDCRGNEWLELVQPS